MQDETSRVSQPDERLGDKAQLSIQERRTANTMGAEEEPHDHLLLDAFAMGREKMY